MSAGADAVNPGRLRAIDMLTVLARLLLAGMFIYLGLNKALHPVEFLKLVRQYDIITSPLLLNLVAATLPWFEIFCGVMLGAGVAVRGTAVMMAAMLIPFTAIVMWRALEIHSAGNIAFCAIKFDCGCGTGAVLICRKLAENLILTVLAGALVFCRQHPFALRPALIKP